MQLKIHLLRTKATNTGERLTIYEHLQLKLEFDFKLLLKSPRGGEECGDPAHTLKKNPTGINALNRLETEFNSLEKKHSII